MKLGHRPSVRRPRTRAVRRRTHAVRRRPRVGDAYESATGIGEPSLAGRASPVTDRASPDYEARRRGKPNPWRVAMVTLVVGLLSGCASQEIDNPFRPDANRATQIAISVENQGFNDARVYAVSVGGVQLLGQVPGKATRNFTLQWSRLDDLRLRMDFLAGDTYRSNAIDVAPGDRVELLIPNDPRGAFLRRR